MSLPAGRSYWCCGNGKKPVEKAWKIADSTSRAFGSTRARRPKGAAEKVCCRGAHSMDDKFSELFDKWHVYTQKMSGLYVRLDVLFTDLGIAKGDIRIIAFISSVRHGEIKFYDSNGLADSSPQFLKTNDKNTTEEHLVELFNIKREQAIFAFENVSAHIKAYDEFGFVHQGHDICTYGIIIQSNQLESSKIVFELLNQISFYCKNVFDNEKFKIEEYMLANIVYVALKKQIDIDFYNTLASSSYERRVASGGILLISGTQQCDLKISFNETYPLEVKNVKQIRKLLEMTTDRFFLVSKNGHAIGIGDYGDISDNVELFTFNGHQRWSYYKNGKELLSYKEGKYNIIFDHHKNFIFNFPKNFISDSKYKYFNSILHEIRQQKHGTTLIISDEAQTEVERLCKFGRGYAIKPVDLKSPDSRALLSSITSIDGAIFLDTNFLCYGVGVILDGIAVSTGLSARGARYNSAQCYIDNKEHQKFTAVVVSEDETIDILHNKA
jgi:hypothetical protein